MEELDNRIPLFHAANCHSMGHKPTPFGESLFNGLKDMTWTQYGWTEGNT